MDSRSALTISIGALGGVAVAFTATVVTVPIWVVFLTWASFVFVGGSPAGWVRSLSCNLVGVVIASASLWAAGVLGGGVAAASVAVGIGSAVMVQMSWIPVLATTPAVVIGFASTVGTVAVTGNSITAGSVSNPGLVAACACILGATFGLAAEYVALALTRSSSTLRSAEGSPAS
jgi:hypothetical protein